MKSRQARHHQRYAAQPVGPPPHPVEGVRGRRWRGPASGPRLVSYPSSDERTRTRLERLHRIALAAESK
ncbi:hypothetical protein [Streptomyces sp. NPDC058629]|uniref:hypothetical protein n=1 Tax=Streptomyces sp. NPDC058629 TaxID=3346565 RepID=UPI003659E81D